jgi:hypothetical protein
MNQLYVIRAMKKLLKKLTAVAPANVFGTTPDIMAAQKASEMKYSMKDTRA